LSYHDEYFADGARKGHQDESLFSVVSFMESPVSTTLFPICIEKKDPSKKCYCVRFQTDLSNPVVNDRVMTILFNDEQFIHFVPLISETQVEPTKLEKRFRTPFQPVLRDIITRKIILLFILGMEIYKKDFEKLYTGISIPFEPLAIQETDITEHAIKYNKKE